MWAIKIFYLIFLNWHVRKEHKTSHVRREYVVVMVLPLGLNARTKYQSIQLIKIARSCTSTTSHFHSGIIIRLITTDHN
jgi:hypothetical protein